eukprot:2037783-Rhodomonas_salina.1
MRCDEVWRRLGWRQPVCTSGRHGAVALSWCVASGEEEAGHHDVWRRDVPGLTHTAVEWSGGGCLVMLRWTCQGSLITHASGRWHSHRDDDVWVTHIWQGSLTP